MLIVFGGLPGTGKTTISRAVAARRLATYLRIDAIEQAMRRFQRWSATSVRGPQCWLHARLAHTDYMFAMPPNANISVRTYQPTDLDAVIAIFLGAIREVASKDYDQAQVDAWARVNRDAWAKRRLSRPTWVAVLGQASVGFTDLEPNGHVDMMFVHPAHQGIGVATLLLETVEAAANVQGISRLFIEASITARPFFEKRGFSVLASQRVEKRGQMLTNFRMQKTLA